MRIATWNVNSLRARLDKVRWWLERARPDVLLMQETKLKDEDAPADAFRELGYELAHHGQGRWNGVAIASRGADRFGGDELRPPAARRRARRTTGDDDPLGEARMIAADCGGIRVVSLYAPNGTDRRLAVLRGQARLVRAPGALARRDRRSAARPLVLGGDFNVAPEDADVWDPRACHGGTHVSPREREAFARLCALAARRRSTARATPSAGRYTWWDYRAGNFHKNFGMRIDHLLATRPLAERTVFAEIDREARKGKPTPSDHAPLVVDLDEPGHPFDAGWTHGRRPDRRAAVGGATDGRRRGARLPDRAADRADAGQARDRAAAGRGVAVRAEVGRLPRHRVSQRRPSSTSRAAT